ncbi:Stp1/IreP family PP2C-type Ser/Thr phosphatase [Noviherbaspirillum saxi]|uniref:Stp1/IreP family PP2C-type Ser/Thr phosphatase n=1 Tax=Noviherbaspirillum saxi TaxID=2320863 RepID=A0A3A3FQX5_9BURK|nr:Stp1/IreP family PP2C-type Ser/Thr phosphatase [Noviherbaspirillum saxi]RJF97880.1 Stp1/IreP family PP2C-type Ser/Thr phosphatase [Noviherbaspirillum saxi]
MAHRLELQIAAKTDTGMVRSHNEDAIFSSPEDGIAILADGMGGYNAGEVASAMAVDVTTQYLKAGLPELTSQRRDTRLHHLVVESIQRANTAILEAAHADERYEGMGTTIVVAIFREDKLTLAHVGDSRAYRLRANQLTQITRDHSLLQEQIDAGLVDPSWAPYAQNRNLVTRAVGVDANMEVEIHEHQVEEGDVYLLCSDGLSDMLLDEKIREIMSQSDMPLEIACDTLVQAANGNGGNDNISVMLVGVHLLQVTRGGLFTRLANWASRFTTTIS